MSLNPDFFSFLLFLFRLYDKYFFVVDLLQNNLVLSKHGAILPQFLDRRPLEFRRLILRWNWDSIAAMLALHIFDSERGVFLGANVFLLRLVGAKAFIYRVSSSS